MEDATKQCWTLNLLNSFEKITPYYISASKEDKTLVFESRFECGNLGLAVKLSDKEYWLALQNDAITKGNTQCIIYLYYLGFYFRVSNSANTNEIHFSIINFVTLDFMRKI